MDLVGMSASDQRQAVDHILVDAGQARGLANATVFLQMLEDAEGFFRWNARGIQRGSLALGKADAASLAEQGPYLLLFAGPALLANVPLPLLSIKNAINVLTTKFIKRAHRDILG
jgi:hypothetical protein